MNSTRLLLPQAGEAQCEEAAAFGRIIILLIGGRTWQSDYQLGRNVRLNVVKLVLWSEMEERRSPRSQTGGLPALSYSC